MSDRVPQKFVGLHNHTCASAYDGLGFPEEHFNWCIKNGLDAHAITEHGNMNSYAAAQLWVENYNKTNKGKLPPFKYLPGIEAYFHPDLQQWARDKEQQEAVAEDKKAAKKIADKKKKDVKTEINVKVDVGEDIDEIETTNALVIENEFDSKNGKSFNPVNRRHHLVILPKNQRGLLKLFGAVSKSYIEGFYRFPRIDAKILKETCSGGDLIVSSACVAGFVSWSIFRELQEFSFDELDQSLLDDPIIMEKCVKAVGNCYDMMVDCVGKENYFLELQFNRLGAQNLTNRAIIEFAKRSNVTNQLIVACDAHYYHPDLWLERELYKKLGFLNYKEYTPDSLPKSKDDLKCELYPKNAQQLWEEYKKIKEGTSFYDDDLICDAIERTHDIAHTVIEDIKPDRTAKFANKLLVPEGEKSFNHLVKLCKEGMVKRGLADKQVYIDRLKEELGVIKLMKNSDYFISYQKIMELSRKVTLCGPGRGSGGGSLVAYVLHITDMDPIRWDLPFARFLSPARQGAPDIDCVHEGHHVLLADGSHKRAIDIVVGDEVLGGDNKLHKITATYNRKLRHYENALWILVEASDGTLGHIVVVPGHKFLLENGEVIHARDVKVDMQLMSTCKVRVKQIVRGGYNSSQASYVDITVEDDHRFHVIPFDVEELDDGSVTYTTTYA